MIDSNVPILDKKSDDKIKELRDERNKIIERRLESYGRFDQSPKRSKQNLLLDCIHFFYKKVSEGVRAKLLQNFGTS